MNRTFRMQITTGLLSATLALVLAAPALAQNEKALKKAFEGKRVVLKIDMPATNSGFRKWPRPSRRMASPSGPARRR